jgi:DNA-binding protein YbaB
MNLNETINNILPSDLKAKLKSAFMQFGAEPVAVAQEGPIKMAEIKLVDGNVVSIEGEFVVGAKIYLVTPEGLVPAPNGEHTAEDGTVVTVMDGVITEIEVETAPELMGEVDKLKTEMAAMAKELASLKAEFSKQTETVKLTLSAINKIVETPVTEPIEAKVDFSSLTPYQKHKLAKYGKV